MRRFDKTRIPGDWGLCLTGHHMFWGMGHGLLLLWPHSIKRMILKSWNYLSCRLLGHDIFGPIDDVEQDVHITRHCVACSKEFP